MRRRNVSDNYDAPLSKAEARQVTARLTRARRQIERTKKAMLNADNRGNLKITVRKGIKLTGLLKNFLESLWKN